MAWYKILFKGGGVLSQAADALANPDEAGYGSDIVRALDESVGDDAFLRKLQVSFSRLSSSTVAEDIAVCTFHLAKNVSGEPSTAWVTGDYTAAEALFGTWWGSLKTYWHTSVKLYQYRWYNTGPAKPISGPPVRITTANVAGTSATPEYAPQTALNVSEHTRVRKHWGRFYLPAPTLDAGDSYGRVAASPRAAIHTATVTLYNGLRSAGLTPVVFSVEKPVRPKKGGGTLPYQPARAYAVESLKTDDIFDVIRRRRYDTPIAFSATDLT